MRVTSALALNTQPVAGTIFTASAYLDGGLTTATSEGCGCAVIFGMRVSDQTTSQLRGSLGLGGKPHARKVYTSLMTSDCSEILKILENSICSRTF
ncbi:hypothetical protein NIES4073_66250 [Kalymmatonema gypsitolerans NIES-4073]|nr:hypothetical protein NIES4073_66250 [Scytonema sp. NIES-4073]